MDPSNTQSGRERTLAALPTKHSDRSNYHRTLRRALKLAHEAVQFDSKNGYPEAAVNAYAQSVALLSEVIERVRNVKDSANTRKSFAPPEDEIKRLQAIHDTYTDRINILRIIYNIPAVPNPPPPTTFLRSRL